MTRTEDLIKFLNSMTREIYAGHLYEPEQKYSREIIEKLRAYDELKEGIKRINDMLSKEV